MPASARPSQHTVRLDLSGSDAPILLTNAPGVAEALCAILTGWQPRLTPISATDARLLWRSGKALAKVQSRQAGLHVRSRFLPDGLGGLTATSAACALVADLSQAFFDSRPGTIALHCGAVQINQRLVVLAGAHRAGKSTLTARLAAETGVTVFCDDVLPVLPDGRAVALGIAPRLRLPLPDPASPALRAHADRWIGPQDSQYGYVCAPSGAPLGQTARISALVMLDRRDGAAACLHHLPADEALQCLLRQNMADLGDAGTAFAKAHDLLADTVALRLVYSDLDAATALLIRAFGGAHVLDLSLTVLPEIPDAPNELTPLPAVPPGLAWQRAPQVAARQIGASQFLWSPGEATLWRLNPVGSAIWTLLQTPSTPADIAGLLAEAFPAVPHQTLADDTGALFAALADQHLIAAAPE